jgi:hypothetical protein
MFTNASNPYVAVESSATQVISALNESAVRKDLSDLERGKSTKRTPGSQRRPHRVRLAPLTAAHPQNKKNRVVEFISRLLQAKQISAGSEPGFGGSRF